MQRRDIFVIYTNQVQVKYRWW